MGDPHAPAGQDPPVPPPPAHDRPDDGRSGRNGDRPREATDDPSGIHGDRHPAGGPRPHQGRRLSEADARTWAFFAHLSALCVFIGIPNVVGPLVVWILGRERHPFVDDQGKEALNFHITLLLAGILAFVATFILGILTLGLGFLVLWVLPVGVFVFGLVMTVVGAVQAQQGVRFRYPLSLRFVR